MEKKNLVLLVFDKKFLESSVQKINFDAVNLTAIFMDGGEKFFKVGEKNFPIISFAKLYEQVKNYRNFIWLVGSCENFRKVKKFLMTFDIAEKNIVDFSTAEKISSTQLANVQHVRKNGADFFATGDENIKTNLNLKFIPHENGANLAEKNQTLRQSYLTAKNIFESSERSKIKFVLIGFSPENFFVDDSEDFFDLQNFIKPSEKIDLNYDGERKNIAFSAKSVTGWEEKIFSEKAAEKNIQILKDYIKLCRENGAEPVGVIFPFAPAMKKTYDKKISERFFQIISNLLSTENFISVNLFDMNLDYDCFSSMTKLNSTGQMFANAKLSMMLYKMNLVPVEGFCSMTYEYLNSLAKFAEKDDYNSLAEKIFAVTAKNISRKEKIKLAFVTRNAAEWCGDDLYNLFANDKHFEVSVFLCLGLSNSKNPLLVQDFWKGVKQFKQQHLNITALDDPNCNIPEQDVLIFLEPYIDVLPKFLRPANLFLTSLITHIPYSFSVSVRGNSFYNKTMFNTTWKVFLSSKIGLDIYSSNNRLNLPRGVFCGYPRTDIFFKRNSNFNFDWKMARSDEKKIIYAPHWSINEGVKYATFQWNYKFMYEFAKNHPEISWAVKPHPALFRSAVKGKIFSSTKEYEKYLQMWDDLPNAQVYTGAYYQGLFATSDGMIHDSGSFIAEYQFVNKPMIFLTRAGEKFNELGEEILKASYLVDGKDFDKISETMQKVFIEGNDYKAPMRKDVYMKYLNYPGHTGMLASDFIYKSIADDLKEEK